MKNTFGCNVAVTLFGESHGEYIGAVLDGLAPGIRIDRDYIAHMLTLRRPDGRISTPRQEADDFKIVSGIVEDQSGNATEPIRISATKSTTTSSAEQVNNMVLRLFISSISVAGSSNHPRRGLPRGEKLLSGLPALCRHAGCHSPKSRYLPRGLSVLCSCIH